MPAFTTFAAAALGGIAVAGQVYSFVQGQKAQKQQKRAMAEQRKQEALKERRQRIQALREAQIKRAVIQNFSEVLGVGGSSSPSGALTSATSQAGTNIGAGSFVTSSNAKIGMFQQKALDAQSNAQLGSTISGIAMQGAQFATGLPGFMSGSSPTIPQGGKASFG